jgi:hypothetical protein
MYTETRINAENDRARENSFSNKDGNIKIMIAKIVINEKAAILFPVRSVFEGVSNSPRDSYHRIYYKKIPKSWAISECSMKTFCGRNR